jgi:hypothetical protein
VNDTRGGRHAGSTQRGARDSTAVNSQHHQLAGAVRGYEERSNIGGTEDGQDGVERKPGHIPNCERHPNGEYWIRIHEVEEVYARVSNDSSHFVMPLHCYGKRTSNAYVSQLDVQRAIDNWDSDGLSDPERVTSADLGASQLRPGLGIPRSGFGGQGGIHSIQPAQRGDRAHEGRDNATRDRSRDGKPTNQPNCGPHPNGEYWIRLRDVSEVYGHVCTIPFEYFYTRSTNDYVHAGDVRYASNQWDAEGILEDIDTQWGMIPEGGALDYCGYGSD